MQRRNLRGSFERAIPDSSRHRDDCGGIQLYIARAVARDGHLVDSHSRMVAVRPAYSWSGLRRCGSANSDAHRRNRPSFNCPSALVYVCSASSSIGDDGLLAIHHPVYALHHRHRNLHKNPNCVGNPDLRHDLVGAYIGGLEFGAAQQTGACNGTPSRMKMNRCSLMDLIRQGFVAGGAIEFPIANAKRLDCYFFNKSSRSATCSGGRTLDNSCPPTPIFW